MARVKLTQSYVDSLPPVPEGRAKIEHCDTALPGLFLEQRAANSEWASYRLRYRNSANKTSYISIGRSCDITLAEARQKAKKLKAEIRLGADPQAEVRERRRVLTWNEFFTEHYLAHARMHLRRWQYLEGMHRNRIGPRFGDVPLNRITKHAVQQFHADLLDEELAPATCDLHLKLIRQAMNLAVEWGFLDQNPVKSMKLFNPDNQVQVKLEGEDLERLLNVLATDKNRMVCNVALFLISSGARLSEALWARWKDIDRDNMVWHVSAEVSKSRKRRQVVLNQAALDVLDSLGTEGKHEYLFVSPRTGQRLTTVSKVWERIRRKAGMPKLRLHDLRHAYASFLANAGFSEFQIMQALGHASTVTTRRYVHLSNESMRRAAGAASDRITEALQSERA